MASFTPIFISISPFAKPQAPPQPVVVLLDATELHIRPPAPLLAFEDLRPDSFKKSPNHPAVRKVKFHPYNRKEANIVPSSARQPTPQPTTSHQISAPPPASADSPATDDLADMSPLSSPASSPRSSPVPNEFRHVSLGVVSTKIKIERPKGAARKNLQDQVKWDPAFMADIKKRARNLVRTHLNDALCFKDQEQSKLNHVRTEMTSKFPRLDDYEHLWPLDIIIMGLLKYSSSHGKGVSDKKAVDTVRGFVMPVVSTSRARRSTAKGTGVATLS